MVESEMNLSERKRTVKMAERVEDG